MVDCIVKTNFKYLVKFFVSVGLATTQVDLLFIELMSHLSRVKHLSRKLILISKITRQGMIFNGDATAKIIVGAELWAYDLPTPIFFDLLPLLLHMNWPFSWVHTDGPIQEAKTWGKCTLVIILDSTKLHRSRQKSE